MATKTSAAYADLHESLRVRQGTSERIVYPETDGEPVGESWWHIMLLTYLLDALRAHLEDAPDVFVAGDMFLYYVEGEPSQRVAPDVMVIKGVENRPRSSYLLWEEQRVPCCIIEILSPRTRMEDLAVKRGLYQELGVQEYFIFDATGSLLDPPMARFQRNDTGEYVRENGLVLESAELGLRFAFENGQIRAYDAATGDPYLDYGDERRAREAERRAREAERRAREAERRAREQEVARLRAEIARLKGDPPPIL